MPLYNKDLKRLDINPSEVKRINDIVTNAFIYRYRDIIIKKYWLYTEYAINDDVFDLLCGINSNNFIKLYELFTIISDNEYKEVYQRFINNKYSFSKNGYTAKYYESYSINPLLESSNYLLSNIEGFIELVEELSKLHIKMSDTKVRNAIFQKDNIVLIDPDYYSISDEDIDSIRNTNYQEILSLLKSIYTKLYFDKVHIINKLFAELENNNSYDSVCEFSKMLKKVNKPINLLDTKKG